MAGLRGMFTPEEITTLLASDRDGSHSIPIGNLIERAYADETLRVLGYCRAQHGITELPVMAGDTGKLVGLVSLA
jgi:CBS domain-containing protein